MKLRSAAVLLIVAATGVWAQTAAPARPLAGRQRTVMATSTDADSKTAEMRAKAAVNQRVQEMETTLTKMHLLLKQMQASPAVKNSKDPMTKANLEMWGLMLQQLDKQFDQVKVAARRRSRGAPVCNVQAGAGEGRTIGKERAGAGASQRDSRAERWSDRNSSERIAAGSGRDSSSRTDARVLVSKLS